MSSDAIGTLRRAGRPKTPLIAIAVVIAAASALGCFCAHYRMGPRQSILSLARTAANNGLRLVHSSDLDGMREKAREYWRGPKELSLVGTLGSWTAPATPENGLAAIRSVKVTGLANPAFLPDMVLEKPSEPNLSRFRAVLGLDTLLAGAVTDYEAARRLASWLGSQWDHGTDEVPGGLRPIQADRVIAAGRAGSRFWCEIASNALVELSSAVGIPARLVTTSQDGYRWDHAVAEVWSNHHGKWLVLDADYNQAYASGGTPLSAWELCHQGPDLLRAGKLQVIPLGRPKPSIVRRDLMWIYAYIHAHLRSDWFSRPLAKGSPAGGDINNIWTKRDTLGPVWSDMRSARTRREFEWPVNTCEIILVGAVPAEPGFVLELDIIAYSPYWVGNEVSVDGGPFRKTGGGSLSVELKPGFHEISARTDTWGGWKGPAKTVVFELGRTGAVAHSQSP